MKNNLKTSNKKQLMLLIILMACIGLNVYQLYTSSTINNSLSQLSNTKGNLTSEIETKTKNLADLTLQTEEANNSISEMNEAIEAITSQTEEMQVEIEALRVEIKSLEDKKAQTQTQSQSQTQEANLNSSLDSIAEQIANQIIAEHPEWINNNQGTAPYEGPHVGTPDTGELINPGYVLGEGGDSGIAPGIIY